MMRAERDEIPLASPPIIPILHPFALSQSPYACRADRAGRHPGPAIISPQTVRNFSMSISAERKQRAYQRIRDQIRRHRITRGPGRDPDRTHHQSPEHFKTHGKDNHSRRGLLKMVSQRRRCSTMSSRPTRTAIRSLSTAWASVGDLAGAGEPAIEHP